VWRKRGFESSADEDVETEFVAFDRVTGWNESQLISRSPEHVRSKSAEPSRDPKNLSHRELADGVASSTGNYCHSKEISPCVQKTDRFSDPLLLGNLCPAVSHGFERARHFFGMVRVWQELVAF
jgi:hypothetical protein